MQIMGAFVQQPMHSTSAKEKRPSFVVSKHDWRGPTQIPPSLIPRILEMDCFKSSEPQSMQGVVPQIWTNHLPRFSLGASIDRSNHTCIPIEHSVERNNFVDLDGRNLEDLSDLVHGGNGKEVGTSLLPNLQKGMSTKTCRRNHTWR